MNSDSILYNMRSLDYEEVNGSALHPGLVYRSALPLFQEEPEMIRILQAHGVRTIIDLRTDEEKSEHCYSEAVLSRFEVISVPIDSFTSVRQPADDYSDYLNPLHHIFQECKTGISRVFSILQARKSYPVLFHCFAGRDRAGVIAALLLDLLGFSKETIVQDYMLSPGAKAANIKQLVAELQRMGGATDYLQQEVGLTLLQIGEVRSNLLVR
ncbi:MAG: tyrosine-protein phosphatase [Candidatus Thorarchaeota archaeon]